MIETLGIKKAHLIIAASVTSLVLIVTTTLLLTKGNSNPEPSVTQVENSLINAQLLEPEKPDESHKNSNKEETTPKEVVQPSKQPRPRMATPQEQPGTPLPEESSQSGSPTPAQGQQGGRSRQPRPPMPIPQGQPGALPPEESSQSGSPTPAQGQQVDQSSQFGSQVPSTPVSSPTKTVVGGLCRAANNPTFSQRSSDISHTNSELVSNFDGGWVTDPNYVNNDTSNTGPGRSNAFDKLNPTSTSVYKMYSGLPKSQEVQSELQVQESNQNTPSTNKGPDKTMPAVALPLPPRRRRSSLSDLSKLQKGEQPQLQVQESNQNTSSTNKGPDKTMPAVAPPLPPRGNNPSTVPSLNRRRSSLSDVPKQPTDHH